MSVPELIEYVFRATKELCHVIFSRTNVRELSFEKKFSRTLQARPQDRNNAFGFFSHWKRTTPLGKNALTLALVWFFSRLLGLEKRICKCCFRLVKRTFDCVYFHLVCWLNRKRTGSIWSKPYWLTLPLVPYHPSKPQEGTMDSELIPQSWTAQ